MHLYGLFNSDLVLTTFSTEEVHTIRLFKTSLDLIKEKPKLIISWVTPLSINLGFAIDAPSSIKGLIESDKFTDREC